MVSSRPHFTPAPNPHDHPWGPMVFHVSVMMMMAREPSCRQRLSPKLSLFPNKLLPHNNQASLVAQIVKNLPTMWETRVQSLGWEDPLEKEMATHSSILAWRIPWTEESGGLPSVGSQRIGHN